MNTKKPTAAQLRVLENLAAGRGANYHCRTIPVGPFYVMIDFEQSAAECKTIEKARAVGQALCDNETLPCSFSIADAAGNHLEDIQRSDGRGLIDQIHAFDAQRGQP